MSRRADVQRPDETVLEARLDASAVRRVYRAIAPVYDLWGRLTESKARRRCLELARIRDGESVLEVAVGTGLAFAEILAANPHGRSEGIDLTEEMLVRARRKAARSGVARYRLAVGDAHQVAYADESFDLLLTNYLFDLLPEPDFPAVLAEFRRVLRPGGRLVTANMTRGDRWYQTAWETLYRVNPAWLGGCRGIHLESYLASAGFADVRREVVSQLGFPTEILCAVKPGMSAEATASIDPPDISREEIRRRGRDPSLILVDALPRESFASGHIPGALSLPLEEISARAAEILPDPAAEIAVYCGSSTCPIAGQAAAALRQLGYSNVRHYRGGLADWRESGAPLEGERASASGESEPPRARAAPQLPRRRQWGQVLLDAIDRQAPSRLFLAWLVMILVCGLVYWLASQTHDHGLRSAGQPLDTGVLGLVTALYFSFVTATSVGYGDVVPLGAVRVVAIAEAVTGLLIFGAVVAKFVSRRHDELVREIHRVTFEERLDRVQMNLHLVLSELQAIADLCDEAANVRPERIGARLESVGLVFTGELRSIHDLLYRPQWTPAEPILGAILASLSAALHELSGLLTCLPARLHRSATLQSTLETVARLANEICGDCVPYAYASSLRVWMDRIHELARRIV
jgi:ubiquinone/menaquinone biosynthesis C-methylase UbiE/rhodanese-related sulfurtransferase